MKAHPIETSSSRKVADAVGLDCAAVFQKIGLDCVAAIKAHRRRACAGDAEAVHQIRVAITRLRAAVAFFAPMVVDAQWRRLKQEVAWLNGPLGAARDSDVVVEYARRKRHRHWARGVIGEKLDQHRTRDHRRLVRCLRSARTQRLVAAMAKWIRQGTWLKRYRRRGDADVQQSHCAAQLDRWYDRLVRKGKHLASLGASRRHRFRIKVKRFRYMLEALTETIAPGGQRQFRRLHRPAKRLQRALGDMRDLKRFADLADGLPTAEHGKRGGKHLPGYRQRKQKLLDAAIAAYRDFRHAGAR
jgi:CHAD domain-containing protein